LSSRAQVIKFFGKLRWLTARDQAPDLDRLQQLVVDGKARPDERIMRSGGGSAQTAVDLDTVDAS